MSGERRVALMFEMSEEAREITLAGLRRQHAGLDEREIVHLERTRRLGAALAVALDQASVSYMIAGSITST